MTYKRSRPLGFIVFLWMCCLWGMNGCGGPTTTTITFRAMVGDKPFQCGQIYEGLGKTKASFAPYDLRMFVHNLRLVDSAGKEVPFQLASDGKWQSSEVALLDFEDATGECKATGTAEVRKTVVGTIPAGTYKGLRWTVGLPFASNHGDAFSAAAPLNTTSMFWSWALGYKFFRLDGKIPSNGDKFYRFHVGSMGCETDPNDFNKVLKCALPNQAEINLASFVPGQHVVTLDIAAMLQEATLDEKTEDRYVGCQAEPNKPQCVPVFRAFGMTYGTTEQTPDDQMAFRATPASTP